MEPVTLFECVNGFVGEITHSPSLVIRHIASHTDHLRPGSLFSLHRNDSRIIEQAIAQGAIALATQEKVDSPLPQIIVANIREFDHFLAQRFYRFDKLSLIGITGTCGKTTTSYILYHLLQRVGMKVALLGTIVNRAPGWEEKARLTTDELLHTYYCLSMMRGVDYPILEATSHGLDQGRLAGLSFARACFTNLSHDHLDYHKSMERYFAAKSLLFQALDEKGVAVVNGDDRFSSRLPLEKRSVITYGSQSSSTLRIDQVFFNLEGSVCRLYHGEKSYELRTPFIGLGNLYNTVAALGIAYSLGFSLAELLHYLPTLPQVPGRLEKVDRGEGKIFIDFAHKPEALRATLLALRPYTSRLLLLFGCGGDRDQGKRVLMGAVAQELADFTFITSDNPRSEDPLKICQQIAAGFTQQQYLTILDRKEAITAAVQSMQRGDILLIAGKGDEERQEIGGEKLFFSDRFFVEQLVAKGTS